MSKHPRGQMSDAFLTAALISASGGLQDAYTYIVRDHVFANAQTGNVVLMSVYFMEGQWTHGLRYLFPLLAFAMGVFVADNIQYHYKHAKALHWRQGVLVVEIAIMALVGFLPEKWSLLANVLISFSCAMQVQAFRKVCGHAYASTMCIGNMRSGMSAFSSYLRTRNKAELHQTLYYIGVIGIFAVGAGVGGLLSMKYSVQTIWISAGILLIGFLMMELDRQ